MPSWFFRIKSFQSLGVGNLGARLVAGFGMGNVAGRLQDPSGTAQKSWTGAAGRPHCMRSGPTPQPAFGAEGGGADLFRK